MTKPAPIPVTLMVDAGSLAALDAQTVLIRLPANTGHGHADGASCPVCSMRSDIRALLFDLLESARQGLRPPFKAVLVDASAVGDTARVVDALTGRLPARALRDHTVARNFYLADAVRTTSGSRPYLR